MPFFQHFVCAKCEKPFLGHRHYERKGLAYCETHYNQVEMGSLSVTHTYVDLSFSTLNVQRELWGNVHWAIHMAF